MAQIVLGLILMPLRTQPTAIIDGGSNLMGLKLRKGDTARALTAGLYIDREVQSTLLRILFYTHNIVEHAHECRQGTTKYVHKKMPYIILTRIRYSRYLPCVHYMALKNNIKHNITLNFIFKSCFKK